MLRREHLVIDSRLEALLTVQQWFQTLYDSLEPELNWVEEYCDRLNIAIAEGFTNAVRHAHAMLPAETPVVINVVLKESRIDIHIWDHGDPFDPDKLDEPEPGSLLQGGGYGWFLLRRAADQVAYERQDDRNRLTITQYRFAKQSQKAEV
ncbi:anti-sigma regulatory factor [Oscillatoria sp. CS-180]|uniref:ATP-binding protein n=1 Tax=Oscillatoria sp. CS-180 TaxID=3021720 RepID=UPI00232C46BA|nr:anti-sigma regulatory factor [Oscillatoria sp. CS-180]MDB9529823.1 anti-sigma regulatory factor [Oscillatoria sp. CS-180]